MKHYLDAIGLPFFECQWVLENCLSSGGRGNSSQAATMELLTSHGHMIRCLNWNNFSLSNTGYMLVICTCQSDLDYMARWIPALSQPCFALLLSPGDFVDTASAESAASLALASIREAFRDFPTALGGMSLLGMQIAHEAAYRSVLATIPLALSCLRASLAVPYPYSDAF